jgi:elongation factor P--beta-lysine ligase
MSERMAKLYERAWNETVEGLSDFKKKIIINNFPYNDSSDKRMADEVVRDAIRLAEQWEMELKGKVTTPAP